MCQWVRPRIGIICAIGPMHLERMRTIDTIVEAKSEILDGVDTAILWVDDPRLAEWPGASRRRGPNLVRVGTRGTGSLDVEVAVDDGDLSVWAGGELVGSAPRRGWPPPREPGCAVAAATRLRGGPSDLGARGSLAPNPATGRRLAPTTPGCRHRRHVQLEPAGAAAAIDRLAAAVERASGGGHPGHGRAGTGPGRRERAVRQGGRRVGGDPRGGRLDQPGCSSEAAVATIVLVADRDEARWVREQPRRETACSGRTTSRPLPLSAEADHRCPPVASRHDRDRSRVRRPLPRARHQHPHRTPGRPGPPRRRGRVVCLYWTKTGHGSGCPHLRSRRLPRAHRPGSTDVELRFPGGSSSGSASGTRPSSSTWCSTAATGARARTAPWPGCSSSPASRSPAPAPAAALAMDKVASARPPLGRPASR
jgi:hypothetical protein